MRPSSVPVPQKIRCKACFTHHSVASPTPNKLSAHVTDVMKSYDRKKEGEELMNAVR